MKRITLAAALFLAGCATTPPPSVRPVANGTEKPERGDLVGLTASELVVRLGTPRIQVREGDGTKLQFASARCVLDAYLYPATSGSGVPRVTHVDARDRSGRDVDQQGCIADILAR
jgi:hypothetical protein